MAEENRRKKQPTAEIAKYKVSYFADDPKLISSKMFKDMGEAKTFADGHSNSLIMEMAGLPVGSDYEWKVIPGGRSNAAYTGMTFVYQYRWWIILLIACIVLYFAWGKMKGKFQFADGGAVPQAAPMAAPAPVAAAPAPVAAPAVDAGATA